MKKYISNLFCSKETSLKDVLKKFDKASSDNTADMNNYSKILYDNFKKILI